MAITLERHSVSKKDDDASINKAGFKKKEAHLDLIA